MHRLSLLHIYHLLLSTAGGVLTVGDLPEIEVDVRRRRRRRERDILSVSSPVVGNALFSDILPVSWLETALSAFWEAVHQRSTARKNNENVIT